MDLQTADIALLLTTVHNCAHTAFWSPVRPGHRIGGFVPPKTLDDSELQNTIQEIQNPEKTEKLFSPFIIIMLVVKIILIA